MDHSEYHEFRTLRPASSESPPRLRVTSTWHRDTIVVTAAGEIDLPTAPELGEALVGALALRPSSLVVDLTPTTFLTCRGLSVIVSAHCLAEGRIPFAVVAGSPVSWRLVQLTEAHQVLTVHRTLEDALTYSSPTPQPLVLRTTVTEAAVLVTATGGTQFGDVEAMTDELLKAHEFGCGVVLLEVSACTLSTVAIVGSVHAAIVCRGSAGCDVWVLTADRKLIEALDAAGIAHCVSAGLIL